MSPRLGILLCALFALVAACKGPDEWLDDLNNLHDDRGRLKPEVYDAGQLSHEAFSGLAVEEALTLPQTARAISAASRVIEGVDQPLLRAQAIRLVGRLTTRTPYPPASSPFEYSDLAKLDDLHVKQIEDLVAKSEIVAVEVSYLPGLRSPDRTVVEFHLEKLRGISGVDVGRNPDAWSTWWAENRDRLLREAAAASVEPMRKLGEMRFGDPERGTAGLGSARAVLKYLGYRPAAYDTPELRSAAEYAIIRVGRQASVHAINYSLRAEDSSLRKAAAAAAAEVADPSFGRSIAYALARESDPGAVAALIQASALFPAADVIEALVAVMVKAEPETKGGADDDRRFGIEARRSLIALSGEDFGLDSAAWRGWWELTGKKRWP